MFPRVDAALDLSTIPRFRFAQSRLLAIAEPNCSPPETHRPFVDCLQKTLGLCRVVDRQLERVAASLAVLDLFPLDQFQTQQLLHLPVNLTLRLPGDLRDLRCRHRRIALQDVDQREQTDLLQARSAGFLRQNFVDDAREEHPKQFATEIEWR